MPESLYASEADRQSSCGWRKTAPPDSPSPGRRPGASVFEPPLDVYETADALVVRVEIAGLRPEELQVFLAPDHTALIIAGRRRDPAAGSPRKYYALEIQCGDFERAFALPVPVEGGAVSASYTDGFLEVVLPKQHTPAPRSRNIPIQ
jgi:HSP20 family protein